MSDSVSTIEKRTHPGITQKLAYQLARYWIVAFALLTGVYVGLPFLAPAFMHLGWTGPGRVIYLVYSLLCHQLPERSYFLFGPKLTYSLAEIQAAWQHSFDPMLLRRFIGNPEMGWKVAWSDRMVSMYTSVVLLGLIWYPLRRRVRTLPWWGLLLFLIPMAVDGGTHFISDLAGIGQGFRFTNAWLAALTNNSLPPAFYYGDALGSFNSWMRILTGILFGLGIVWFGLPYVDDVFTSQAAEMKAKFHPTGRVPG